MATPLVSVIIPAFNGEEFLGEAIQSVLNQTYEHFELIVVDDASTDSTSSVIRGFNDSRLTHLTHSQNRDVDATRRTGFDASSGSIVAFLDQDDIFHRNKLAAHVSFLEENPDVGLTYNSHFMLVSPPGWVSGIWRPPEPLGLEDIALGFPLPPSAWVLRREWAAMPECWDESARLRGSEVTICGRLWLRGCRFAFVDRALNYRRTHVGRRFSAIEAKSREERLCQQILLDDPRCPSGIRALHDAAAAGNYLMWAHVALSQKETELGRRLLREAVRLDPTVLDGCPNRLVEFFLGYAVVETNDLERYLELIFDQLPEELADLREDFNWAKGQAQLVKGAQHVMWGRPERSQHHFQRAAQLNAAVDEVVQGRLSYELLKFDCEFGFRQTALILRQLGSAITTLGGSRAWRGLLAKFHLAKAFHHYERGRHTTVPSSIIRAAVSSPRTMFDRGIWSVFFRSASAGLANSRQATSANHVTPVSSGIRSTSSVTAGRPQTPGLNRNRAEA